MQKKTIAIMIAAAMIVSFAIGGVVAWLAAKTEKITNTFTPSDVKLTLTETNAEYKMIPGYTIAKDPKVTVEKGSEKCYVFVKLEKSTNAAFDSYMTYEMAEGWTQGDGTNIPKEVWYRTVEANASDDQSFDVIKDNQVTVKEDVTKKMMNDLTQDTYPKLTITAYACQYNKSNTQQFSAKEAWDIAKALDNTTPTP